MKSQTGIIQCKGVATNPNPLVVGDGWCGDLLNITLARPDIASSRRGRQYVAMLGATHHKMFPYSGAIITSWNTNSVSKLAGGAYTTLTGSATAWSSRRLQAAVASDNLYLGDSSKLKKLSGLSGSIEEAGGPRGLSFDRSRPSRATSNITRTANVVTATFGSAHGHRVGDYLYKTTNTANFPSGLKKITAIPSSTTLTYDETAANAADGAPHTFDPAVLGETSGFLSDGKQVAYRYVIYKRDSNKNLITGAVSGRVIVPNSSITLGYSAAAARNVILFALLPSDVTTDHFIQLYRSDQVNVGTVPDDELLLVYEAPITADQVTARRACIRDIVPDGTRGDLIYTRAANGGIAVSKEKPPACFDVALFRNRLFGANTYARQRFVLSILSVGGTEGIQNNDVIYIDNTSFTALTTPTNDTGEFKIETGGTVSQNNENTALNLVAAINRTSTTYQARYISSEDDFVAKVEIWTADPNATPFNVQAGAGSRRECYSPVLAHRQTTYAGTASRVGTRVTVTGANTFKPGESITIQAATGGLSNGTFTCVTSVTTGGSPQFEYDDSASGAVAGKDVTANSLALTKSAGDVRTNRVVYSEFGEPEAFPLANYVDVGPADAVIEKIAATDDQITVFTTRGLYRIVPVSDGFEAEIISEKVKTIAPETVVKIGQAVAAWTNQGVLRVNGLQLDLLSEDIEDQLRENKAARGANLVRTGAVAMAYESENQYMLALPAAASANPDSCEEMWVCHLADDRPRWTSWTFPTKVRCAVYNPEDELWYIADAETVNDSYLYKERKTLAVDDYQDDLGNGSSATAIPKLIEWIVQTAGAPGRVKCWHEASVLFPTTGAPETGMTFVDQNGNTDSDSLAAPTGTEARTYVRASCARGTRLKIRVTHSTDRQAFDVAGLAVSYEVLGNQVTP